MKASEFITEKWSQKYKNSINCSHPKGFSQRAHCAGKRKHNEDTTMEAVCPDCGMCQTHGNMTLSEIKQRLDPKCWKGKHKEGTKIKGGVRVNNCVPNESVAEGSVKDINDIVEKYCAQQGITRRDLTNYDVKQLSKLSGLPTYYIRDQLIKTSPGVTEGEVVPFRRPQAQSSLPADILHLANEWFHANDDTNTLQAVTDQDYGQGADNLVKYIQAKLQSKGWTIDFDDEIDNIVLRNRLGQTVSLPVNDAYNETGWAKELAEEFDLIESIIDDLAKHNGVDSEAIWEDLESLTDDELYVFATTTTIMETEAWQKANKKDRTDGMSRKAVKTYRREHPGSKLQTAVTTKPSKLKKGSKASKRRKSYCSRSKGQMKMHNISCAKTPDKAICKARRRWNC